MTKKERSLYDKLELDVRHELDNAMSKFPSFNSAHEGYAVILEEFDELWEEVKKNPRKRSLLKMRREAIQVAAMAMRFLIDVKEAP